MTNGMGVHNGYEQERTRSKRTRSKPTRSSSRTNRNSSRTPSCRLMKSTKWSWPLSFWKSRAKRNSISFSAAFLRKSGKA